MSWDYVYTKDVEPEIMHEILLIDDTLEPKYDTVKMTGLAALGATDNLKFTFNAALDAAEKAALDVLVDTYETNPVTGALLTTHYTRRGHSIGFETYQKIFGLITSQGGLGSLDAGRVGFKTYLTPVRMMLKDGMPESAYREYIKVVEPTGMFNQVTQDIIRKWMRRLCTDRRDVATYPTEADFLPVLTAIETAEEGTL
jgi:hypothetical protein